MFEYDRNEISKEQAIDVLPNREMFKGALLDISKTLSPGGMVLHSTVVEHIQSALKIEAMGGYPYFPWIRCLEITINDGKILLVDFEQRIDTTKYGLGA